MCNYLLKGMEIPRVFLYKSENKMMSDHLNSNMKLKYNKPNEKNEKMKIDKLDDIKRRYKQLKSEERFDKFFKIKGSKKNLEYTKLLRESIREL
jgi:hypothetical protein